MEYFARFVKGSNTFSTFAAEPDDDGRIALSHEPGIGVVVDEATVAVMEYTPVSDDQKIKAVSVV